MCSVTIQDCVYLQIERYNVLTERCRRDLWIDNKGLFFLWIYYLCVFNLQKFIKPYSYKFCILLLVVFQQSL